jgi:hypothetical protein
MRATDEEWVNWEDCWRRIPVESAGDRYQEKYWGPVRRAMGSRKPKVGLRNGRESE